MSGTSQELEKFNIYQNNTNKRIRGHLAKSTNGKLRMLNDKDNEIFHFNPKYEIIQNVSLDVSVEPDKSFPIAPKAGSILDDQKATWDKKLAAYNKMTKSQYNYVSPLPNKQKANDILS